MPYVSDTIEGNETIKKSILAIHLKKHFSAEELDRAERAEALSSSFKDPGPDWNQYVLYDKDGHEFARTPQIPGY
jgi:hypothetical protein